MYPSVGAKVVRWRCNSASEVGDEEEGRARGEDVAALLVVMLFVLLLMARHSYLSGRRGGGAVSLALLRELHCLS